MNLIESSATVPIHSTYNVQYTYKPIIIGRKWLDGSPGLFEADPFKECAEIILSDCIILYHYFFPPSNIPLGPVSFHVSRPIKAQDILHFVPRIHASSPVKLTMHSLHDVMNERVLARINHMAAVDGEEISWRGILSRVCDVNDKSCGTSIAVMRVAKWQRLSFINLMIVKEVNWRSENYDEPRNHEAENSKRIPRIIFPCVLCNPELSLYSRRNLDLMLLQDLTLEEWLAHTQVEERRIFNLMTQFKFRCQSSYVHDGQIQGKFDVHSQHSKIICCTLTVDSSWKFMATLKTHHLQEPLRYCFLNWIAFRFNARSLSAVPGIVWKLNGQLTVNSPILSRVHISNFTCISKTTLTSDPNLYVFYNVQCNIFSLSFKIKDMGVYPVLKFDSCCIASWLTASKCCRSELAFLYPVGLCSLKTAGEENYKCRLKAGRHRRGRHLPVFRYNILLARRTNLSLTMAAFNAVLDAKSCLERTGSHLLNVSQLAIKCLMLLMCPTRGVTYILLVYEFNFVKKSYQRNLKLCKFTNDGTF
ncbi:hypothetical protein C0J52_08642 [Blattella germanica]|nr:hypothetical protein C0J52_08642 [Blattella germanica]